jgi:3'(2'), 5'-bisphosphate nucleotidase
MVNNVSELPLAGLLEVVRKANDAILEIYNSTTQVDINYKTDNSPVTSADMAAHTILHTELHRLYPDMPIISEESIDEEYTVMKGGSYWLIDPIDGTKEFIAHSGQFVICLALIIDGKPVFGIMSAPALNCIYYGGLNVGSYKINGNNSPYPIKPTQPARAIFTSGESQNEETKQYIATHYSDFKIKLMGSQLKFAYVAEGAASAYPRLGTNMKLWDIAAGHAILDGVGGEVVRPDGSSIDYYSHDFLAGDFVARLA